MQNFGVYIFTTHRNHDRCACVEETWGRNVENLYFFTDRETGRPRYLKVTDDDDYASHIEKNYEAMKFAFERRKDLDWHFFIGDDNYVFLDNFRAFLGTLDPSGPRGYGVVGKSWPRDPGLRYLSGGAGHLFSRAFLKRFWEGAPLPLRRWKLFGFSDVAIGWIVRDLGLELVDAPGFFTHPPERHGIDDPRRHIAFHYIKTGDQFIRLFKSELGMPLEPRPPETIPSPAAVRSGGWTRLARRAVRALRRPRKLWEAAQLQFLLFRRRSRKGPGRP